MLIRIQKGFNARVRITKKQDPDINSNGSDNDEKNIHHGFADNLIEADLVPWD